jgi:hypothetical protein
MNDKIKIVIEIPLFSIWKGTENLALFRQNYLTKEEVKRIISVGAVHFVIADVGKELMWVEINNCYDFWKSEVKKHISDDYNQIMLENFPGNYVYLASEWKGEIEDTVILLEKLH